MSVLIFKCGQGRKSMFILGKLDTEKPFRGIPRILKAVLSSDLLGSWITFIEPTKLRIKSGDYITFFHTVVIRPSSARRAMWLFPTTLLEHLAPTVVYISKSQLQTEAWNLTCCILLLPGVARPGESLIGSPEVLILPFMFKSGS